MVAIFMKIIIDSWIVSISAVLIGISIVFFKNKFR